VTGSVNATGAIRLVWLVPLLPLAGFAVNTLVGRRLARTAGWLATLLLAAAFAVTVAALVELLGRDPGARVAILRGYAWFVSGDLRVAFDLRVDPLSITLALVVTGVGSLIHLYSIGYMAADARKGTYFAWLNLFAAAMLILVLAQNFLVMFLGWEGVGLCSYLLIGFWFSRPEVPAAAKKAFIVNRIGDVGFLIAMFLIFASFRSLDFDQVFGRAGSLTGATATAIALLLFLACTGKSAQIPLFVWLPDAMAGPTPVSALIHAATMVTAGVFLVARTHVLFEASSAAGTTVVAIGALTAMLAALIAIGQDDIKRILAYSTVSQLGYMFIAVGLGPIGYAAGIFHLVTHAFFKAQLFLGAGSVMHGNDDATDIKQLGGLRRLMPLTFVTTMAGWLAIIGFPFTSGFYSKDQILGAAFDHGGIGRAAWVIGVLTAGLTGFYMSRLVFLTFFGERRWPEGRHPHESPSVMTIPMLVLGLLALVAGFTLSTFTGVGGRIQEFLQPVLGQAPEVAGASLSAVWLSAIATALAFSGVGVAWYLYGSGRVQWLALRERFAFAWRVLAGKLYVDELYELFTVRLGGALVRFLAGPVDSGVIDGAVNGVAGAVSTAASRGRRLQTGLVRTYAVGVLGGAVLLLAFLVLRTSS
jgi:NADH-quinone oxidoreductase subunit L